MTVKTGLKKEEAEELKKKLEAGKILALSTCFVNRLTVTAL